MLLKAWKDIFLMKQQGFILVTTMAILLLLTLLAVGAAETSLMLSKQTSVQWQFWRASTAANNVNRELAQILNSNKSLPCLVNYQIDNRYWSQLVTNWGSAKCEDKQMDVKTYSVIENIPQDFCLEQDKGKTQAIDLFRITTQTETTQGIVLHVQSVVSAPAKKTGACTNVISQLSFGIQSWRMG